MKEKAWGMERVDETRRVMSMYLRCPYIGMGKIKPVGDSQKVYREMIAWATEKYGHQEI